MVLQGRGNGDDAGERPRRPSEYSGAPGQVRVATRTLTAKIRRSRPQTATDRRSDAPELERGRQQGRGRRADQHDRGRREPGRRVEAQEAGHHVADRDGTGRRAALREREGEADDEPDPGEQGTGPQHGNRPATAGPRRDHRALPSIWSASRMHSPANTRRSTIVLTRGPTRDPICAPAMIPRATGAAMNGSSWPRA